LLGLFLERDGRGHGDAGAPGEGLAGAFLNWCYRTTCLPPSLFRSCADAFLS
jgi:hypothetical protein